MSSTNHLSSIDHPAASPVAEDRSSVRRLNLRLQIALLLLTVIVAGQVVTFEFVSWDDGKYIVGNPRYHAGLTLESIQWALTTREYGFWIPVTRLSFLTDVSLFGMNGRAFHATQLATHIIATLLLFRVLTQMTGQAWPAAFVAALFAIHPLHAETLGWANDRNDVLCGLFWILTLLAYQRYARQPALGHYLLTVCMLLLAVASKPMAATLPCVLMLLDYWPLGRLDWGQSTPQYSGHNESPIRQRSLGWLIAEKIPLLVLGIGALAAAVAVKEEHDLLVSDNLYPMSSRFSNAAVSYATYIAQTFYPRGLAFYYPHPRLFGGIPDWQVWLSAGVLVLVTGWAVARMKRQPALIVGWLWYLGTLVPAIGIVQVSTSARGDRYTYLPLIGLFLMLAWGIPRTWLAKPILGRVIRLAACVFVLVSAILGARQISTWRNSRALYEHAIAVQPNNFKALMNLASIEVQEDHPDRALALYDQAIATAPMYARPYQNKAAFLGRQGQLDEAVSLYKKAIELAPGYAVPYENLGNIYVRQKKYPEAIEHFQKCIRLNPPSREVWEPRLLEKIGLVQVTAGQVAEGIATYRLIIERYPQHNSVACKLAWLLATHDDPQIRQPEDSLRIARRVDEATGHSNPYVLDALAAALAVNGQFDAAVAAAEQARKLAEASHDQTLITQLESRLAIYRAGHPYIESAN